MFALSPLDLMACDVCDARRQANCAETINSLTFAARAKAVKLGKATQRAAPKGPAKAKK